MSAVATCCGMMPSRNAPTSSGVISCEPPFTGSCAAGEGSLLLGASGFTFGFWLQTGPAATSNKMNENIKWTADLRNCRDHEATAVPPRLRNKVVDSADSLLNDTEACFTYLTFAHP